MQNISGMATILACVLLGAAGQIVIKLGVSQPALSAPLESGNLADFMVRAALSPLVLLGLFLYAATTALWLVILAKEELSYAYPFISIAFVVTTIYGWAALGESVSLLRISGVGLIIVGVIVVARS